VSEREKEKFFPFLLLFLLRAPISLLVPRSLGLDVESDGTDVKEPRLDCFLGSEKSLVVVSKKT